MKCEDLAQWACEARSVVAASGLPNYQYSRIKVPTENQQLEGSKYGFPLCVDKQAVQYNTNVSTLTLAQNEVNDQFNLIQKHQ